MNLDILRPEMAFFVFIFGIAIGSFLNVLIDRIPRNEKITGRSYCESCKKTLKWYELIPLLSFILIKGKCKSCKSSLSYQYPAVELITGAMFLLSYLFFPFPVSVFNMFVISVLIVIFLIDYKEGIIPDKIIFPSILITTIYLLINSNLFINHVLSAIGACLFFLLLFLITKAKGIGFGDVKFALLLGLLFGFPGTFFVLYLAFLTGGLVGLILILWRKKNLKSQIPFGPFLALGGIITLFLNQHLIKLFTTLL